MGSKNIYERFVWFDHRVRSQKYPNATSLSSGFEISVKTAQRDIEFMRDRLSDLKVLENTFTVPKSFNIQEHLQSAFGIYKGIPTKEVCLRFSPEKARWIVGQVWHKDQKTKINRNGSLELSFPVADFREVMMEILKQGSGVEVIRPKALRELIREEARKIARIY